MINSGQNIQGYIIEDQLGSGGFGEVYLAHREADPAKQYAIKMLKPQFIRDAAKREKFVNEMINMARLSSHPSIVSIYENLSYMDREGEHLGMVMEYVQGMSLDRFIYSQGKLVAAKAVPLFLQVLLTIQAAHDQNIIHRDLKPANIMVMNDQEITFMGLKTHPIRVLDFGLAKAMEGSSASDSMSGATLAYMPPERLTGGAVGFATDIYSLGAVLYELLTGTVPFTIDSIHDALRLIPTATPAPVTDYYEHHPTALNAVVMKALAKNPLERYHSCKEFAEALVQVDLGEGGQEQAKLEEAVASEFSSSAGGSTTGFINPGVIPLPGAVTMSPAWLYTSFQGRISRSVYWKRFALPCGMGSLLAMVLDFVFFCILIGPIYSILSLLIIYPSLAVAVKRLHDRNRSGWFALIAVVPPILGALWLFVELAFLRGSKGVNMFGPDPLQSGTTVPPVPRRKKQSKAREKPPVPDNRNDSSKPACGIINCLHGEYEGSEIPVKATLTAGTDASHCNLILTDPKISRSHFHLTWRENDNSYLLEDQGSLNGTYVQGSSSAITNPVVLQPGDTFGLAKGVITFRVG